MANGGLRRYFGLAHIRWELPFLLRVPANAFLCWEPQEGIGTFAPGARVGAIQWQRTTPLLSAQQAFGDAFGDCTEPPNALPTNDYRMTAVIGGTEYLTTQLTRGVSGGFTEAHAYSVANLWLCLRSRAEFSLAPLLTRALAALNNALTVHAFLMPDGRSRLLRPGLDSYCTIASLAQVPEQWEQTDAEGLLLRLNELTFGSEMGTSRHQQLGIGSADDLTVRPFPAATLEHWMSFVRQEVRLDLHQRMLIAAVRRLSRREHFLAVIDAETAVEVCISGFVRQAMRSRGSTDEQIDAAMESNLNRPQQQVVYLDRFARAIDATRPRFEGSDVYSRWTRNLARLRHDIVHRGLRVVDEEAAVAAVAAGVEATIYLERLVPDFATGLRWDESFARLDHIRPHSGKLSRLFDA